MTLAKKARKARKVLTEFDLKGGEKLDTQGSAYAETAPRSYMCMASLRSSFD